MTTDRDEHGWGPALRARREQRGLNQGELAEAAGLTRTRVSDLERSRKHIQPEPETVAGLIAALDWPELPRVVEESERRHRSRFEARLTPTQPDGNYRPLYEYGVAGDPQNQDEAPPAADRIAIPPGAPDELRRQPDSFAVRVRGTSMEGMQIREGSIVWCLPAREVRIAQGEPVVAWILNERDDLHGNVVKQYLRGAGPQGQDCLGSVYADGRREVVYCDEFKVVGVVKAIQPPTILPVPLRPPVRYPHPQPGQ